jgi:hypothetical protein
MSKKPWMPRSQRIAREINFLAAFYDAGAPTYQDGKASAVLAGFKEKSASRVAENLLEKYRGFDFKAITRAMSIDRISIGLALKKILQGDAAPRDVLSASRLLLANMGEQTDSSSINKNVNVAAPVMLIVGATSERLEALRRGGAPIDVKGRTRELPAASDDEEIEVDGPLTEEEKRRLKEFGWTEHDCDPQEECRICDEAIEKEFAATGNQKIALGTPTRDARQLSAAGFSGRNLIERAKGPSY